MLRTYTQLRTQFASEAIKRGYGEDEEELDDEFADEFEDEDSDEQEDYEDDADIVRSVDQQAGAGALKAAIPTQSTEQDSDDPSAVEWREVEAVRPIVKRGPNGTYTHVTANEEVEHEDVEEITENILHKLQKIVSRNQRSPFTFHDGTTSVIELDTATNVLKTYGGLNPKNQAKFAQRMQNSQQGFEEMADFAFSQVRN